MGQEGAAHREMGGRTRQQLLVLLPVACCCPQLRAAPAGLYPANGRLAIGSVIPRSLEAEMLGDVLAE